MQQNPDDLLRNLPGYVLRRASSAMMSKLAARLSPLGIRQVEATILLVLAQQRKISQSDLCRLLGIKRANMTPLAIRLEEQGLIKRQATDGRSLCLELTERGSLLAGQVQIIIESHEKALIERISPEHRAHFLPALVALWDDQESE